MAAAAALRLIVLACPTLVRLLPGLGPDLRRESWFAVARAALGGMIADVAGGRSDGVGELGGALDSRSDGALVW